MRLRVVLGIAVSAVFCATFAVADAQQPPTLRADIVSTSAGDYPAARAVVSIENTGTVDVKSLTAANFQATVNGKPARILSADLASSQNAPLDVLLLMDISGSMAGEPIKQSKDAATGLIQALAPNDRVAVISFADTVTLVQDFTADRALASAAIAGLTAWGNTALYDATAAAAFKAATSQSPRRAIILLSDGANGGVTAKTPRDQALSAATAAGVPFFAIGEGKDIDRAYLTQLSTVSKGRYLEAPKVSDLGGLFTSISELLTSQFIVTFDGSAASGAQEAPIAITVQSGAASVTAQGTFKPGPNFSPPVIVSVTGISAGEALSEQRVITAVPDRTEGLTRVAFYVDGVNVYETAKPPYTFTYDPKAFGSAAHTLKASVMAGTRSFDSAPVSFTSHAPAVAPKSGGGVSLPWLPIAAALIIVALVGIVATVVMRARRDRGGDLSGPAADQRITPWVARHRNFSEPPLEAVEETPEGAEEVGEPMGVLISRAGPLLGTEYVVGGKPMSIGSGTGCGVHIRDMALSTEEARIWVRDGHLMVHKMTRLTAIAADGVSGGWTILEPGDRLDIGAHAFEFRLWSAPPPESEREDVEPAEVPNVLRDPNTPRPIGSRPTALPLAASGLGAIWPREDAPRPMNDQPSDLDAQAG